MIAQAFGIASAVCVVTGSGSLRDAAMVVLAGAVGYLLIDNIATDLRFPHTRAYGPGFEPPDLSSLGSASRPPGHQPVARASISDPSDGRVCSTP